MLEMLEMLVSVMDMWHSEGSESVHLLRGELGEGE
jgi:hypothetical protein